jgi:hypothetical protein
VRGITAGQKDRPSRGGQVMVGTAPGASPDAGSPAIWRLRSAAKPADRPGQAAAWRREREFAEDAPKESPFFPDHGRRTGQEASDVLNAAQGGTSPELDDRGARLLRAHPAPPSSKEFNVGDEMTQTMKLCAT